MTPEDVEEAEQDADDDDDDDDEADEDDQPAAKPGKSVAKRSGKSKPKAAHDLVEERRKALERPRILHRQPLGGLGRGQR